MKPTPPRRPPLPGPSGPSGPSDPDAAAADRLLDMMLARALGGATPPAELDLTAAILDAIDRESEANDVDDSDSHHQTGETEMPTPRPTPLKRSLVRDRRHATRRPDQAPIWWIVSATAAALVVVGTIALAILTHDAGHDEPDTPQPDNPPSLAGDGDQDPAPAPQPVKPWFDGTHRMATLTADRIWFSADGQTVAVVRDDQMLAIGPARVLAEENGEQKLRPVMEWPQEPANNGPRFPGERRTPTMRAHARFTAAGLLVSTTSGLVLIDPKSGDRSSLASGANQVAAVSPDGLRIVVKTGDAHRLLQVEPVDGPAPVVPLPAGFQPGAFSSNSAELYGTAGDGIGKVVRVSAENGTVTDVASGAAVIAACKAGPGVEITKMNVTAVHGSGNSARIQLSAHQKNFWDDPGNEGMSGTHTYGRAPRGRNPGSAEPGPPPPSWELLLQPGDTGATVTLLHKRHLARYIDSLMVLPARDLSTFTFFQIAQGGGAGDADNPEVWVGTIDPAGQKQETKLADGAFPADWRNLDLSVLDRSDDGKLLLLVQGDVTLERAWGNGGQGIMQAMQAGFTITRMWSDNKGSYVGTPVFGLFRVDCAAGTVTKLAAFGENVPELKDKVTVVAGAQVRGCNWVPGAGCAVTRILVGGGMFGNNAGAKERTLLINAADWRTR